MELTGNIELSLDAYTVGWVCVKDSELTAARVLLDKSHHCPYRPSHDGYTYFVGQMGEHNVAIAKSNTTGKSAAATTATNMVRTFKQIRFVLMVGIAGGATNAPSPPGLQGTQDIFLGDVVVSYPHGNHGGVMEYDKGKLHPGGYKEVRQHLNKPGTILIQAVSTLQNNHGLGFGKMSEYIQQAVDKLRRVGNLAFAFPGREHDRLFHPEYHHVETEEEDELCGKCLTAHVVKRTPRDEPIVHYGLVGSADTIMADAKLRDTMRRAEKVLCFEMEAAGIMDSIPCLAIRGISDYADSHKNQLWQPYAALTAAAYAKDLLAVIQPQTVADAEVAFKQLQGIKHDVAGIRTKLEDSQLKEIYNWLTCLDFSAIQQSLFDNRAPIGNWLIESEAFKHWVNGTRWQLRCYGAAGVGKTNLCALVVNHLQNTFTKAVQDRPVIYVYLGDGQDKPQELTKGNIMGSLVKQLILFGGGVNLPEKLKKASLNQTPCESIMKEAFEELIRAYERTYLIVDGSYQCPGDIQEFLINYPLELIRQGFCLSLLTTSPGYRYVAKVIHCDICEKPNLGIYYNCDCNGEDYDLCLECKDSGKSCPHMHIGRETYDTVYIEVRAREGEIAHFCRHRLARESSHDSRRWDKRIHPIPPFKRSGVARYLSEDPGPIAQIAEVIAEKAQGNFLIAQCWLKKLLKSKTKPRDSNQLLASLEYIPLDTLRDCFKERIESIRRHKSVEDRIIAFRTFSVLMSAYRRINILTLQHALAFNSDPYAMADGDLIDREIILRATNGLITIDKTNEANSFVQLLHDSMRIALADSDLDPSLKDPHSKMASLCIEYLAHEEYPEHSTNLSAYPFLSYALEYWGDHVSKAKDDCGIADKTFKLLKERDKVKSIAQNAGDLRSPKTPSRWIHGDIGALHFCGWFDLSQIIRMLCKDGYDINLLDCRFKRTPLRYASVNGSLNTVRELLKLGATASKAAVKDAIHGIPGTERLHDEELRRVEITEEILRASGLTLDSGIASQETTALMYAAKEGYYNFVEALLKNSSFDINVQDRNGRTALWYAVGARPAPLIPLSTHLRDGVVKLLLEKNASPNVRCQVTGKTLLAHAITKGNLASVSALFECDDLPLHDAKHLIHLANARGDPEVIDIVHCVILKNGIPVATHDVEEEGQQQLMPPPDAGRLNSQQSAVVDETLRNLGADLSASGGTLSELEIRPMEAGVNLKRDLSTVDEGDVSERKRFKVQ
ncbi:hypothetical protein BDV11DRAFT_171447 [Aspergillus similis]